MVLIPRPPPLQKGARNDPPVCGRKWFERRQFLGLDRQNLRRCFFVSKGVARAIRPAKYFQASLRRRSISPNRGQFGNSPTNTTGDRSIDRHIPDTATCTYYNLLLTTTLLLLLLTATTASASTTYYCLLRLTTTYYELLRVTTTHYYLLLLTTTYYYLLLLTTTD